MERILENKKLILRHNYGEKNTTQIGVFDTIKKDGLTKNTHIIKPYIKVVHVLDTTNKLSSMYTAEEQEEVIKVLYNYPKRTTTVMTTFEGKTFVGVAKCRKTDIFDTSIGSNIATLRMRIKINEYKLEKAMKLVQRGWR